MSENIAQVQTVTKSSSAVTATNQGQNASKRLRGELMSLMKSQTKDIKAFPEGDNLFKWNGTIVGPAETVYEGLTYKLALEFSTDYPFSPPKITFITHCFHPNVDVNGNICLDILKEKWSASYDVKAVLLSIQSLLGEPNNKSPLNGTAAEMWSNQIVYKKYLHENYHSKNDGASKK